MRDLLSAAMGRRALAQIRYISPVEPQAAPDLAARVYAQVRRDFGMLAPPVALHSPEPSVMAACWLMLRETLLAAGAVDRVTKEAIAAAVSIANTCPYCVDVHTATMGALVRGPAAAAIASDRLDQVGDAGLRGIAGWARASGTRQPAGPRAVPGSGGQISEIVGVVVTFHYLNRMVNVFLGESPLPSGAPAVVRRGLRRALGRVMGPAASRRLEPGVSLDLLPSAPLPADMTWAAASPTVAAAFARAAAAIGVAGSQVVPAAVRALATTTVAGWDGRPKGPSRAWVDEAVAGLAPAEIPAGRLALLTALASYQVDRSVIDDFRRHHPGDETLIAFTAWASLLAARAVAATMDADQRARPAL